MNSKSAQWIDLSVMDIMEQCPETLQIFIQHRMLCIGCMVSQFHTISDACELHGLNEDQVVSELLSCISKYQ